MRDVRTILLGKIKPGNKNEYFNIFSSNTIQGKSVNNFITLGNYDLVKVYDPQESYCENESEFSNILDCFQKEKEKLVDEYSTTDHKSNTFFHPIHIIYEKNTGNSDQEEIETVNRFWNDSKACFGITFIYTSNFKDRIEILEKKINDTVDLKPDNYLIYRSANLSELVLVCKKNSLPEMLKGISKISYTYPDLYTHTVCGFRYEIGKNAESSGVATDTIVDDEIDFVKISGSIREHKLAISLLNNIGYKEHPSDIYIAFGNNDFNIVYKKVKTKRVIAALNAWMKDFEAVDKAFASIKTRVHLKHIDQALPANSIISDTNGYKVIKESQRLALECRNIQKQHTKWVYPYTETLNMLLDMYSNPALARIRFFTINTIFVFNKALYDVLQDGNSQADIFLKSCEQKLVDFSTGLNALIEQLVRIDGYLSQEPGYSPLIYNMVPAGILEYYCAYIYRVTDTINEVFQKDSHSNDDKYSYATLPLPKFEKYISFYDILHNEENPNKANQVNLLEIPYNSIYEPKKTLFSVTHEIMHFCGETIRQRRLRYDCLIEFIVMHLMYEFALGRDKTIFQYIHSYISSRLEYTDVEYFDTLFPKLRECIIALYLDVDFKNTIQNLVTHDNVVGYKKYDVIKWINNRTTEKNLLKILSDIKSLFSECYADLITIQLLQITDVNEYIKVFDSLAQKSEKHSAYENAIIDMSFLLRKTLVIYTSGNTDLSKCDPLLVELFGILKDIDNNKNCVHAQEKLIREICIKYRNVGFREPEINFTELFFAPLCLKSIIKYLKSCAEEFDRVYCMDEYSDKLNDIKVFYDIGTEDECFFNQDYCGFMHDTRYEISEKIAKEFSKDKGT